MKPPLLLLSNHKNSDPEEDLFLSHFLEKWYKVTVAHPFESEKYEDEADVILVRNIWPTGNDVQKFNTIKQRFLDKHLPAYNPLVGSGDMQGKSYLVSLWRAGLPVIPTVDRAEGIERFLSATEYLAKPIHGGSGLGIIPLTLDTIHTRDLSGYVLQPKLEIKREVSFYFIDNKLLYALAADDPTQRWVLKEYAPTAQEKFIAQTFAAWNTLPFGVQRIDFVITDDNEFLLLEIEDWCPYLSLLDIDKSLRNCFLNNLVSSIQSLFF